MADKETDMGLRTSLLFGAAVTLALSLGAAGADAKDGKGAGGGSKAGASSSSSGKGKKAGNNNLGSLTRAERRAASALNDRQEAKLNGLLRQITNVERQQDSLGARKADLQSSLKDARKQAARGGVTQGERNRLDRLRDRLGDVRTAQQREADRRATLRDRVRSLLGLPARGTPTDDGTTDPAATGPTPLILAYGSGGNGNFSVGNPTPLVPEGERLVVTGVGSGGQSGGNSIVAPISP